MDMSLGAILALIKKYGGSGSGGGSSGGEKFVIDLAYTTVDNPQNPVTCTTATSDIVAAYKAGKTIEARVAYTDAVPITFNAHCDIGYISEIIEDDFTVEAMIIAVEWKSLVLQNGPMRDADYCIFGIAVPDVNSGGISDITWIYGDFSLSEISERLLILENGLENLLSPVSISGTTPTITGDANRRYICGEVSTLTITPPSSGDIEVIFESGSTPTVLTVPNTVKFPEWFDATSLEANRTYDIIITNGVYGVVTSWA